MSHESSSSLPRVGDPPQPWERAEPSVRSDLRRLFGAVGTIRATLDVLRDGLHGIERSLTELVTARKAELADVIELKAELAKVRATADEAKSALDGLKAAEKAIEQAEERAIRRDWGALLKRLLGILAGAGGGVGLYHWLG